MANNYEVNIKIKEKELTDKINAYCNINHCTYMAFATKVFDQFFKSEKNQLEMMSKEQLIETILKWKKEDRNE